MQMTGSCSSSLLLLAVGAAAQSSGISDQATNLALLTDATQPPAIRAFNLRTFQLITVVEYDIESLVDLGISREYDGRNRTLRPAGLALLETAYADSVYWADAGAGAVLGLRFDGSPLRVMASGLGQPEPVVLDQSGTAYQQTGGCTAARLELTRRLKLSRACLSPA